MKIRQFFFASILACAVAAPAADRKAGDQGYIKVEIKGRLQMGLVAIGGETTGTTIRVNNVTWELDLGTGKDLRDTARKLDDQMVLVTGTYRRAKGVEIADRHIVKVATLKAADGD
ncbi:MAG: hypothetical protein AB1705_24240 [Verrucomicrobiota bacterium]